MLVPESSTQFLYGHEVGTLPSEISVQKLMKGEPGSLIDVIGMTAARAFFIALPFFFLKIEPWKVAVGALSASTIITAFVALKVSQDPKT